MQTNLASSLAHVLVHEGGYVDHPKDPGGATNKGITLAVFQRAYGASKGKAELKTITDEQVAAIYKTDYWDKCRCDDLPAGIDYVVFDQAVNSGPGRSVKWLQAALGVAVDGGIGPNTLAATKTSDGAKVINAMCDERLAFMKRIKDGELWKTFGRGWQKRVDGVRKHGLALVKGKSAEPEAATKPVVSSVDYEVVREGDRGEWVEKLQAALGIGVDGIFGAGTDAALKAYQEEAGLTADGVAGRNTYRVLGLMT